MLAVRSARPLAEAQAFLGPAQLISLSALPCVAVRSARPLAEAQAFLGPAQLISLSALPCVAVRSARPPAEAPLQLRNLCGSPVRKAKS